LTFPFRSFWSAPTAVRWQWTLAWPGLLLAAAMRACSSKSLTSLVGVKNENGRHLAPAPFGLRKRGPGELVIRPARTQTVPRGCLQSKPRSQSAPLQVSLCGVARSVEAKERAPIEILSRRHPLTSTKPCCAEARSCAFYTAAVAPAASRRLKTAPVGPLAGEIAPLMRTSSIVRQLVKPVLGRDPVLGHDLAVVASATVTDTGR